MNKQNIYENVRYYIGKITVILMMVLFPFVMTDKLNNVTKTRYVFFVIIALVGWIAMLINEVVLRIIISGDYPGAKKSLDIKKNFNIKIIYNIKNRKHIIYSVLLIASSIISYLVSPYKNIALYGAGSRYIGMIFFIAVALLYWTVSECYEFKEIDVILILAASIMVHIVAVFNYMNIDILHLFSNLTIKEQTVYMSTLGNINVYGMYTGLTLSIAIAAYYKAETAAKEIFYYIAVISGIIGIIICDSDMALVAVVIPLVILFPYSIKSVALIKKYIVTLTAVLLAGRVAGCIKLIIPDKVRKLSNIMSGLISTNNIFNIIIIVLLLLYVLIVLSDNRLQKLLDNIKIRIVQIIYCVMAGGFGIYAIVRVISDNINKIGAFYITDNWGSGRGYIWSNLINGYKNYPFIYKIFGLGEGTVRKNLSYYSDSHWDILYGNVVDNAHSIWLQMLVTMGCVGVIILLVIFIHTLVNSAKYCVPDIIAGFGMAALVYAVQGAGNILEVITFPMFICAMAIVNCNKKIVK